MNTTISRKIRYLLPILALIWTSAQAAELNVPNTFTGGSKAMASEVNANFDAVEAAVNDNDARITALQDQVADLLDTVNLLTDRVETLEGELADLNAASAEQFVADLQTVMDVDTANDRVTFSGVNVHVNSGAGSTSAAVNGLGNLIVGYDEAGSDKSGSHNIVVGTAHTYSSHSGLVVGTENTISGPGATVTAGAFNVASGTGSSVSGGSANTASNDYSSVSGGISGIASGVNSTVNGGNINTASGDQSSVSGGSENIASGAGSSISGGSSNLAVGNDSSVSGGTSNTASGTSSSVGGNAGLVADDVNEHLP